MNEVLMQSFELLVSAILPIVVAFAAAQLRAYMTSLAEKAESEIGSTWWWALEESARNFIKAAEQTAGVETGEEKKQYVMNLLSEWAATANIPVSDEILDGIIEGVYKGIKDSRDRKVEEGRIASTS